MTHIHGTEVCLPSWGLFTCDGLWGNFKLCTLMILSLPLVGGGLLGEEGLCGWVTPGS